MRGYNQFMRLKPHNFTGDMFVYANVSRWKQKDSKLALTEWLHTPEVAAKKSIGLTNYWRSLTPEQRQERSALTASRKPFVFVLNDGEDQDVNLRKLLGRTPRGDVSHKMIDKIVRTSGRFNGHVIIEKRKR